jgi:ABC-2 type transport system permease protein
VSAGAEATRGAGRELRKVWALLRADALTATSYRLRMVLALAGMLFSFIPLFFVTEALQPVVADSIRDEGGRYFGFLLLGFALTAYAGFAMSSLLDSVGSGIGSGTLEALFATPTRLPVLLAGMMSYRFARTTAQGVLLLAAIAVVGTPVAWQRLPLAAGVVVLVVFAYLGVGLVAAALHLAFRTAGPLVPAVLALSTLLGGVYFSTTVIPDVVRPLANVVPLTYGLRAVRQTLLHGAPLTEVWRDVTVLAGFAALLMLVGASAFRSGLRHARRTGTLAQY